MQVKLILEGNEIVILQSTPKIDNYIDQVTRFRARGYEHTDEYKNGDWDGYTRLYHIPQRTLPIGMLEDVEMMLTLKDINYEVIDTRVYRQFDKIRIDTTVTLRDYQEDAVRTAIRQKRALIQLPTGAGKTLVGIYITKELGVPTVFYVHKKELLYQTLRAYRKTLVFPKCKACPDNKNKQNGTCQHPHCPIGMVGDGHVDLKPITIAMIQTASRLPKQLLTEFGLMIGDEVHHLAADMYADLAVQTKSEYAIGLSATIRREDGKEMLIKAGVGPIVYNISISDLIKRRYLATPHVHALRVSPVLFSQRTRYPEVYDKAITCNVERNDLIALKAIELSEFGAVYVHVRLIDHGEILKNKINRMIAAKQPHAVFIHGKDKTDYRTEVLDAFRANKQPILISTLLGEGVDLPNMYALILAAGGQSGTLIRQVFGRLLRISEHEIVLFYDVADQCKYLYDHFLNRVSFYQSEPAFVLEDYLQKIKTGE